MKELDKHQLISNRQAIESVQHKQKEIDLTFIESLKPLKGHRLFEINNSTLEVVEAQYHKDELVTWWDALKAFNNPNTQVVKDVIIKPYHSYISALSPKSALKRYKENKGSASLPESDMKIQMF